MQHYLHIFITIICALFVSCSSHSVKSNTSENTIPAPVNELPAVITSDISMKQDLYEDSPYKGRWVVPNEKGVVIFLQGDPFQTLAVLNVVKECQKDGSLGVIDFSFTYPPKMTFIGKPEGIVKAKEAFLNPDIDRNNESLWQEVDRHLMSEIKHNHGFTQAYASFLEGKGVIKLNDKNVEVLGLVDATGPKGVLDMVELMAALNHE